MQYTRHSNEWGGSFLSALRQIVTDRLIAIQKELYRAKLIEIGIEGGTTHLCWIYG